MEEHANFRLICVRERSIAMRLREFFVRLARPFMSFGATFEHARTHDHEPAAMHARAAKEHQQAARQHEQAAKLHDIGAHGAAAWKGDQAATTSHRATKLAEEASSAEGETKAQSDLASGRLYLGD